MKEAEASMAYSSRASAEAKAKMRCGELPEAMEDLDGLLSEVEKAGNDRTLAREIRATLGAFHYYAAWLMRLEGASTEEWTEQVEQSRQHYRLLAESSQAAATKGLPLK